MISLLYMIGRRSSILSEEKNSQIRRKIYTKKIPC